jgi:hypothetical protein
MARPKVFHGSIVGVKLSESVDSRLRKEAEETGKSLSCLIRNALMKVWGDDPQFQKMRSD